MSFALKSPLIEAECIIIGCLLLTASAIATEPNQVNAPSCGLQFAILTHGDGPQIQNGQVVLVHYRGTLYDGTVFDDSHSRAAPFAFTLGRGQVIKGWEQAFPKLHVGDLAMLTIPPELGYGAIARGRIPANSILRFEVEVLGVKSRSFADELQAAIGADGVAAANSYYERYKSQKDEVSYVSEVQINALGYRYLRSKHIDYALAVFNINVQLFPNSSNAYDSLAEAYLIGGYHSAALRCCQKALALDPKNENARKMADDLSTAANAPAKSSP